MESIKKIENRQEDNYVCNSSTVEHKKPLFLQHDLLFHEKIARCAHSGDSAMSDADVIITLNQLFVAGCGSTQENHLIYVSCIPL